MANGDKHFDVRVTTSVDNKGTEAASAELKNLEGGAKSLVATYREAGGGLKGLTAIGKEIKEVYESADRGISGVWKVVSTVGKGMAATIAAIGLAAVGAKKAIEEFSGAEKGIRQMQAALAQHGQLTGQINEKYQEMADSMERATGESANKWIEVITRLTQHGSSPSTIERDVKAVEDFAGITGDVESASVAISKALEGNFEMFTRWGIKVDESKSLAEQLSEAFKQIADRGEGQLRANTETLTGSFHDLHNAWNKFWESVGFRISQTGVLQYVLTGLTGTLSLFSKLLGGTVEPLQKMQNAVEVTSKSIEDATLVNKKYAEGLKEIAALNDAVSESLDRVIQKQRESARQKDEETDAKMALQLAEVDMLEARKKLSPKQAIEARASIRIRSEAEKRQRAEDLRTNERGYLQQKTEAALANDEEAEEFAVNAENIAKNSRDLVVKRRKLAIRLKKELQFWKDQFAGFEADPWNYENKELGITKGPRTEVDMAHIDRKISEQIITAKKRLESELPAFDKQFGPIPNENNILAQEKRAKEARKAATDTHIENAKVINESLEKIDKLNQESEHAQRMASIKAKTSALEAGKDIYKNAVEEFDKSQSENHDSKITVHSNPAKLQGKQPRQALQFKLNKEGDEDSSHFKLSKSKGEESAVNNPALDREVSRVTQSILQQSGAFHSEFQNMGDAIVKSLESLAHANRDLTNRVEILRKQFENKRNR